MHYYFSVLHIISKFLFYFYQNENFQDILVILLIYVEVYSIRENFLQNFSELTKQKETISSNGANFFIAKG